jgi:putative redox protein
MSEAKAEMKTVWKGDMTFESEGRKDFGVVLDSRPEVGGEHKGFTPTELLLVSLAGCTGMDVLSILKKKRQDVQGFEVITRGKRGEEHPRVYTEIQVEYVVRGRNIDPKAVERSIFLSEEKYCPVGNMLNKASRIISTYRIEEA